MPFVTRKTLLVLGGLSAAAVFAAGGFVWSGVYNIAADDLHTRPVYALMDTMRERSIAVRANKLHPPPNLDDPALIRQGAGNYNAMCMSCHLAPGMAETELSKGLYPAPPNLSKQTVDAASAFWVIKHGIKASGMPAWGGSMDDEFIWNMSAFLQKLPKLDKAGYQALVASSDGHSHGGGETGGHSHGEEAGADHHGGGDSEEMGDGHGHGQGHEAGGMGMDMSKPKEGTTHVHADGKTHVHAAEPAKQPAQAKSEGEHDQHGSMPAKPAEPAPKADDGHDHQH